MTGGQMRDAEKAAIRTGKVTGATLMQRAGQGVFDAISKRWPDLAMRRGTRALILCGPGNNGGDGFVVACLLASAGWSVDVALLGDPARLPPDAAANHAKWVDGGRHPVWPLADVAGLIGRDGGHDLMVDALFGTGLSRAVAEDVMQVLRLAIGRAGHSVAIDILSGLCADSGRWLGADAGLSVDLTVTFHIARPGHVLSAGATATRALRIVDIGLPAPSASQNDTLAQLIDSSGDVASVAHKDPAAHKFGSGHALVLSGGAGRTGAARLAARAALRIGAGLVTLGVPPAAQQEVACQITALMLARVPDAPALVALLHDHRLSALCLGPGLGIGARTRALVVAALQADRAVVLDADALTSFSDDPEALFDLSRGTRTVLTPHGGEFARLFPDLAERLAATPATGPAWSRLDAVQAASARAGCTVLLKGADTVIAAPDAPVHVHAACRGRAAPWLATAGAGDVLAGLITGLLARGQAPLDAAARAAWLHVECARHVGPGLIAEDLPEALPGVLRALI